MLKNGIDLVEIERIRQSCENPAFVNHVFGEEERTQFAMQKHPEQHMAGAFAAKEAFAKALGTGIRGFSLCEVEILHDALGAPYFALSGQAKALADERNLEFTLSITHTDALAAAFVTAYKKGEIL
ncbi:MAG: holo-ACP synthase [Candidatus Fimenecus sp.]